MEIWGRAQIKLAVGLTVVVHGDETITTTYLHYLTCKSIQIQKLTHYAVWFEALPEISKNSGLHIHPLKCNGAIVQ